MRPLLFFLLVVVAFQSYAQVPIVQQFEPLNTFPHDTLVITGTGFDSNPANLEVWFDDVEGEIISSTGNSIEVVVPMEARASNIEVINKASKLSGKSIKKFIPTYEGVGFDVSKIVNEKTFTSGDEHWDLCACDFDGDGKPDIVTTKFTRPSTVFTPAPTDIVVLKNKSVPGAVDFDRFDKTNMAVLNLSFPTDNVVCGDLQGDGLPEIIVTRAGATRNSIHILKNTSTVGNISFAAKMDLFMAESAYLATRMALKDLNRDGKPEIIVTNSSNAEFYIFINQSSAGNLSFTSTKLDIKVSPTDALKTYEVDVQDFNNDGLGDIVINQFQTKDLYLLRNVSQGSISFAEPQRLDLSGNFNRMASADFNNDGKLDIVLTNTILDRADVLINQTAAGATTFSFATPIALATDTDPSKSSEPWGIDIGDINGDHNVDIIVANKNSTPVQSTELNLNVFLNNGASTPVFTKLNIPTDQPTRNVKVNDFDGDGKPDIAFTGFNEATQISQISVLRNRNCHQATILNTETEFCNPRSVKLQAVPAGNVTFAWEKDGVGTGGNTADLTITAGGVYKVTVTGESGTCSSSAQITMVKTTGSAPSMPSITANTPVCAGQSLNLSTPTVAGATYQWTGPNGFTSTTQNPVRASSTNAFAGEYSLQVKITSTGCTSNVSTKIVEIADITDFAISSNLAGMLCEGNSVTLSVNNLPNHTYSWKKNGVATGATGTSVVVTEDGSYTVFVTNTSIAGCSAETAAKEVTLFATPIAGFTVNNTLCKGVEASFTNTSDPDDRVTPIYSWNFGDTQTSTDTNPTHTYNPVGTPSNFTVTLTVSYEGVSGCTDSENTMVTVVEKSIPTIQSSAAKVCPDGTVELSLPAGFTIVQWSTGETTPTITASAGDYTVTATDANNCEVEGTLTLEAFAAPVLTVTANRTDITAGDTTMLHVSGAETYVWSPASELQNPEMATAASPIASPSQRTTYVVVGTAPAADGGCSAEGQVTINVVGAAALFPLAFSPNGDGDNEDWKWLTGAGSDCLMTVFDGRGRRVFEKKSENWDGTYNGKPVPEGTYYYVYGCPNVKPVTGTVLVFR